MPPDGPAQLPPTTMQRLVAPLGFAAAAGLFILGTALVFRTQVAEVLIEDALRDVGLSDVSLNVSKLGAGNLTIEDLTAENGALRIARIDTDFSLQGLLNARLDSLSVDELNASLTWDGTGVRLGNFRPRPDSGPLDLPTIGKVRASDMMLVIATPTASFRAPLSLTADAVEKGWNTTAAGTLEGTGVKVALEWAGVIAPADLAQSSGRGRFDLAIDDFVLPDTADRLDAHGLVTLEAGNGVFAVGVAKPLTFSTSLSPNAGRSRFLQDLEKLPWSVTIAPTQSEAALVFTADGERRSVRFDIAAAGKAGDGGLALAFVGEASRTPQVTEFQLAKGHAEIQKLPFGGGAVSGHVTVSKLAGNTGAAEGHIDAALDLVGVTIAEAKLDEAHASVASTLRVAKGGATFDFETLRISLVRGAFGAWSLAAPAELGIVKTEKTPQRVAINPLGLNVTTELALSLTELTLRNLGTGEGQIIARVPDLRVRSKATALALDADIAAVNVSLSHPNAEMRDGRMEAKLDGGDLSGALSARFVRLGAPVEGVKPSSALTTKAALTTVGNDYEIRGSFATAAGSKLADYTVRVGSDLGSGTAALSMAKTRFERGGKLDAADLAFIAPVSDLSGTIGLEAKATWSEKRRTQSAIATLDDVSFAMGDVSVAGLTTSLELAALSPPRSKTPHRMSAQSITAGLPLTDLTAEYTLPGDGTIAVKQASVNAAGGQIKLSDASIPIDGRAGAFSLSLQKIDMSQLAAQAKVDGLAVTGTLSGTLPMRSDETGYHFVEGVLRADAPGRVVYKPASPSPALSQNQGGALMLQALSNFAYDRLSITVNGPITEEISLLVAIAGKNPDLYGGYPIEFNLNLSGRLTQILRQGLVSYASPVDLERQIRESKPPGP